MLAIVSVSVGHNTPSNRGWREKERKGKKEANTRVNKKLSGFWLYFGHLSPLRSANNGPLVLFLY